MALYTEFGVNPVNDWDAYDEVHRRGGLVVPDSDSWLSHGLAAGAPPHSTFTIVKDAFAKAMISDAISGQT